MGEGRVYLCKWRVEDEAYHVWVEKRPRLIARGDSIAEASQHLVDLICEVTGDGEALLELDPPPEGRAGFVALSANSSWYFPERITRAECAALFEGGICDVCSRGAGPRSGVPLPLGMVDEGDIQTCWATFCDAVIASDRLRTLLTAREREAFEWRAVEQPARVRRRFFEVVAKQPIHCVVDRKERVVGWGCQGCGRRVFGVRGKFNPFIAADDVARPTPKVLAIQGRSLQLALPAERWRALRGRAGAKGIVAKAVTVLPSSRVWRRPRLPNLTRAQVRAARKQFEWQLAGGKWDLLPGDVPVGHKR